jgi:hypothetical protein
MVGKGGGNSARTSGTIRHKQSPKHPYCGNNSTTLNRKAQPAGPVSVLAA